MNRKLIYFLLLEGSGEEINESRTHSDTAMHGDSLCSLVPLFLRGSRTYKMVDCGFRFYYLSTV